MVDENHLLLRSDRVWETVGLLGEIFLASCPSPVGETSRVAFRIVLVASDFFSKCFRVDEVSFGDANPFYRVLGWETCHACHLSLTLDGASTCPPSVYLMSPVVAIAFVMALDLLLVVCVLALMLVILLLHAMGCAMKHASTSCGGCVMVKDFDFCDAC